MMSVRRVGVKSSVQSIELTEGVDHSSSASHDHRSNGASALRLICFWKIFVSRQVKLSAYLRLGNWSSLRFAKSASLQPGC